MSGFEHYDEELAALDKRIGRLALLCRADLSDQSVIIHLIKGQFDACPDPHAIDAAHLQELRALLMMKYKIETSCVDALGAEQCAKIIRDQDQCMQRLGFPAHGKPS